MQDNWQWCSKCSGLTFFGNGALGACSAGGDHDHAGSANYQLAGADESTDGQDAWRWCVRCQGLYFVGNGSHGFCPAGGPHSDAGSGNYRLRTDGPGQNAWRWCANCQALWFSGDNVAGTIGPFMGRCPAPGQHGHVERDSGDYTLPILFSPAAPSPVIGEAWDGSLLVDGFGDRWVAMAWVEPHPEHPGDGSDLELWEVTGPGSDRFIIRIPIDSNSWEVHLDGDIFPRLRHCFAIVVVNRYGRSQQTRGCGLAGAP
jgi:hypothetical protein